MAGSEFNYAEARGYNPLKGDDAEFLADLATDPGETRNLRRAQPEIAADLRQRLERWTSEVTAP